MISVRAVLSRADEFVLQETLGKNAWKLVSLLEQTPLTAERALTLIDRLNSPASLLLQPNIRHHLIELLRPDEVKYLVSILGVSTEEEPYGAINSLPFSRGSDQERALFDFFRAESTVPASERCSF